MKDEIEKRDIPPPAHRDQNGRLLYMVSKEEDYFITKSNEVAFELLGNPTEATEVEMSYPAFIGEMERRGYAREFANIALSNFGFRPGTRTRIVHG